MNCNINLMSQTSLTDSGLRFSSEQRFQVRVRGGAFLCHAFP
jgi:hypothetical protein